MEFRLLDGEACSTRSLVHSMKSADGVDGGLVPVGLGGPPAPAPFPCLLLQILPIAQ